MFLLLVYYSPKTDTCKTCDTFKVKVDAERDEAKLAQLRGEWELHLCKAECSYQQLKEDSALGKSDPNVLVITFSLHLSSISANFGLITSVYTTVVQRVDTCTCGTKEWRLEDLTK